MITTLYIENIAVIEKTNIDFTAGFNVLTGETGAGKSIVIDAINAVLGQRTSKDIIRTGAQRAFVSAVFEQPGKETEKALEKRGILPEEDDTLILQREIYLSGKNVCRINARPVPVSVLKEVAASLINIHGQHESYELMSAEHHQAYIDNFGALQAELSAYRQIFAQLKTRKHALDNAQTDDAQRQRQIDLLRYQTWEIDSARLEKDELARLTEKKNAVVHQEKINHAILGAYTLLNGEIDGNALAPLVQANSFLQQAEAYLPQLAKLSARMQDAFYELQDCASELAVLLEENAEEQDSLEQIEERLDTIYKLSRKYGATVEEILQFSENAHKELESLTQFEAHLEKLQEEFETFLQKAADLAKCLSDKRRKTAQLFAHRVREEMTYLDMPNVRLTFDFKRTPLTENGCDRVELLLSANPGEAPKPVSKIASGGELSRMMLAIKNVLADKDGTQTLIFDEVDTGISGSAAQKVGYKLKAVSNGRQVICVTHQAQIAALADTHFLIKKTVEDNRTFTQVEKLSQTQRTHELARIIGGVEITELTLRHAEEMLKKQ